MKSPSGADMQRKECALAYLCNYRKLNELAQIRNRTKGQCWVVLKLKNIFVIQNI